jgi:hypothetical protein
VEEGISAVSWILQKVCLTGTGYFAEGIFYRFESADYVFGGFVNRRLRRISRDALQAWRDWNPEVYRQAADRYLQAVEEDIRRTKRAVVQRAK